MRECLRRFLVNLLGLDGLRWRVKCLETELERRDEEVRALKLRVSVIEQDNWALRSGSYQA